MQQPFQIERYSSRIEAARNDIGELGRIADELQALAGPHAMLLRFRAIKLRAALRHGQSVSSQMAIAESPRPVPRWLSDLGLPSPDGRALYLYRLSDEAFGRLEALLKICGSDKLGGRNTFFAAQFVLWGAEWFRRTYNGTTQRWEALAEPLGLSGQSIHYRKWADDGLAYWKIPPLRINGTHYRLAAIARQGGFPLAAVEGKGGGWAAGFLERLVGTLLDEPEHTLDAAERIALSLMDLVPAKWRNQEIRVVSAELAVEVVRLRRLAEVGGAPPGLLISAWLDRHDPTWRENLPVGVTSAAGRALVDGLMKANVLRGQSGAAKVRRLLQIDPGGRRELVELRLAGTLIDAEGNLVGRGLAAQWSRLRLFAAGDFARHVSGELATVEPDERGVWIARPTTTRVLFDLSDSVPVLAELRGEGQRIGEPFLFAGGAAINSNLRVYVAEGEPDQNDPQRFALVGTGSGGYRAGRLHVDIPAGWACEPHGPGARCEVWPGGGSGDRLVWSIEGAAVVTSRRGDGYLVRAGQAGDHRDRLALEGTRLSGCVHAGEPVPIFLGPPRISLFETRDPRAPARGEAWWRPRDAANWRPDPARAEPGLCDFAWRDAQTRHIRDRTTAVVLPAGFQINRTRTSDTLELAVAGWPGRVEIDAGRALGADRWRFDLKAGSRSSAILRLFSTDLPALRLSLALPHHAWIYDWTSGPLQPTTALSISTINSYVARADGRCELFAELYDRQRRPVPQGIASWWVDGELPLSTIRDDLAALLRPIADLDATLILSFNDGNRNTWRVREFDHEIRRSGQVWWPDRPVTDTNVRIVGRALHNAAQEQDFGEYRASTDLEILAFDLPALDGPWLIYLRSNERVLSRPKFVAEEPLPASPHDKLGQAAMIPDYNARRAAMLGVVDAVLAAPAQPDHRATIQAIIDLVLSLDGLPPSTFDVLSLVRERPLLGTTMLFFAAPSTLEPLMRLLDGIPMAWTLAPRACWDQAAEGLFAYLNELIPEELMAIASAIGGRRRAIAELYPALAPLLELTVKSEPLAQAANAFMNRSSDRLRDQPSPFRPHYDVELPHWKFDEQFWRALDAPVAAARVVMGHLALSDAEILCIKDIERRHPRWFAEGFVAVLKE